LRKKLLLHKYAVGGKIGRQNVSPGVVSDDDHHLGVPNVSMRLPERFDAVEKMIGRIRLEQIGDDFSRRRTLARRSVVAPSFLPGTVWFSAKESMYAAPYVKHGWLSIVEPRSRDGINRGNDNDD
jgi:hypothetical protein